MTLEKDTLIHNRYRIVEILGQGGMGSVYRAIDENLGVSVALKENLFTTDEYARQFRLEAVILANLRHPNLPRVSDHFVLGDMGQYLIMDFIEGEDLRYRMERIGMLSEDDAIHIGASIADALAYLHTRKPPILHRDIKPGNVKIAPDGHIFLVDFGLAKVYQSASQATTTGARAMTPGYSPPEQYGTARTDPRTDIYSLGATLYAALSGVIPEDGLARAMDNAQLTPLRKRNSKVTRRLAAAIEKAMAVDPSDRYQDAEDFKKALLSSKSKTQQTPGNYIVEPPPPDVQAPKEDAENSASPSEVKSQPKAQRPKTPIRPHTLQEEQPFISPLKRQKERERKQRASLMRTIFAILILVLIGIPFLAPGIVPDNVRAMIPFIVPTATATFAPATIAPTETPTTLFTSLPSATPTMTLRPTSTPGPTNTSVPGIVVDTQQPTESVPSPVPVTLMGGGTGQVAFASDRNGGTPQIFLADITANSATQLTNMPNGACQPDWSPDGQKLVFISPCTGNDDVFKNASLYLVNADGSGLTPLDASPGGNFDPAWSSDGSRIAFTSLRTGQMEIFTIVPDGSSTAEQVTSGEQRFESRMPSWSPDGLQLVYVVKRLGVYQIWMMDSDGSGQQQIIRSGTKYTDYSPVWSPRGDLILFNQSCVDQYCNPYLMSISPTDRLDEQGARANQNIIGPVKHVAYSPDGFYLAYEGIEEVGNMDIFLITVAGADRVRLTTDPAEDFHPAWRPATPTP